MKKVNVNKQHGKLFGLIVVSLAIVALSSTLVVSGGITHLKAPDDAADCYECHKKATPKIAQDWYESKHGVALMKCFVCHGQPDGKGSVPWAVVPDPIDVCQKCHDPAMKRMAEKYGVEPDCYKCHPFHQNSLHHEAYKKSESSTK